MCVDPMVRDFVRGINCTLFTYGPERTGKTFSAIGESADPEECGAAVHIIRDMWRQLDVLLSLM